MPFIAYYIGDGGRKLHQKAPECLLLICLLTYGFNDLGQD